MHRSRANNAVSISAHCVLTILVAFYGGRLSGAEKPSCPSTKSADDALALLNAARTVPRNCGTKAFPAAAPLAWNSQLESAAAAHSKDMAARNFFAHKDPDGVTASQRIAAQGYRPYRATGENISAGHATLEAAMNSWLSSAGHCENIMNAAFKHYAVACASSKSSEYGVYWTQVFGAKQ